MGFKTPKQAAKVKGNDPRNFAIPGTNVIATITLADDGSCKGFSVGAGRFVSVRVPAALIDAGFLSKAATEAAVKAADAVDAAMAAKSFSPKQEAGYVSWSFVGAGNGATAVNAATTKAKA